MQFEDYQAVTFDTAIYPQDKALEYLSLGLVSEAGEIAGVVKKKIRDNTYSLEFRDKMKKEMGDLMWYFAQLCDSLDLEFEDILKSNIDKLASRKERNQLMGNGDDR